MRRIAQTIEQWFDRHNGDGDFVITHNKASYTVSSSKLRRQPLIYCTKPVFVASAFRRESKASSISLLGHCGLPPANDLPWIKSFVKGRRVYFVGDMDPPDLLIFKWLQNRLLPKEIKYLGVSDEMLIAADMVNDIKSLFIPMSQVESESYRALLSTDATLMSLVGTRCAQCLSKGYKIELDAILSHSKRSAHRLFTLIR